MMNSLPIWSILLFFAITFGCKISTHSSSSPVSFTPPISIQSGCPDNYILVPGNTDFNTTDFCVSKYEAKQVNGVAVSQAATAPWTALTRDAAKAACTAKGAGYALLDNAHWMTIARNIESVTWNFGGDASISEYGVSRGVTNNTSTQGLEASSDDNQSCYLATQSAAGAPAVCNLHSYDVARRVHQLSNGDYLWDFAGNVSEWVADDFTQNYGTNSWILNLAAGSVKNLFGPAGTYTAGPTNPSGNIFMYNFGYISSNLAAPSVALRGGGWNYGRYAGIYTAYFAASTHTGTDVGFRCIYQH